MVSIRPVGLCSCWWLRWVVVGGGVLDLAGGLWGRGLGRWRRRWSSGGCCCGRRLGWLRRRGWFGCCGVVTASGWVWGVSVDCELGASAQRAAESLWPTARGGGLAFARSCGGV